MPLPEMYESLLQRMNHWQTNTRMGNTSDYVVRQIRWDETGHSMTGEFVDREGKTYRVTPVLNGMPTSGSPLWVPLQKQLRELMAIVDQQVAIADEDINATG